MKRVLAIAALLLGVAGAFAVPAGAETACVDVYVDLNGQVVEQSQCV